VTTERSRERARGDARQAILVATIEVIGADGIDAVTHRRVAQRAGVSPGSTTHHFSSRKDLLREAFRYYIREADALMAELEEAVRVSHPEPLEWLRESLRRLLEYELESTDVLRAEYELLLFASTDDDLATDVRGWEARMVANKAAALEAAGSPRPIEAARTLVNLVRGFELERLLNPQIGVEDFERRLETFLAPLEGRAGDGAAQRIT
jgi:TetR/AcrR family transcriptional regulator, regulator of biofilm formation and stress response